MAVARAVLLVFVGLAPVRSSAVTGVITDSRVPVLREAAAGAQAELGGEARLYDLAKLQAEEIHRQVERDKPEALVAIGPPAVRVLESAPGIPVVLLLVPNAPAVAQALPGRPVRAITLHVEPEEVLRVLRRLAPEARTLWTIYSERGSGTVVGRLQYVAAEQGLALEKAAVEDAAEAARAVSNPPERVDAAFLFGDPVVRNAAFDQALLRLAFTRRFPVVGSSRSDVQAGALLAYQLDPAALGRQAARLARATGEKPEVVAPEGSGLLLNLASARHLGLTVPEDLREAAAEVFGQ